MSRAGMVVKLLCLTLALFVVVTAADQFLPREWAILILLIFCLPTYVLVGQGIVRRGRAGSGRS